MRRFLVTAWLAVGSVVASVAMAQDVPIPAPPRMGASGYILLDHDSGEVLAESNADERLEPASLTKLMTSYVVFKALREGLVGLEDAVYVSEKAWRTGGSRTFIDVDTHVPLETLLLGMIVQSGNDASIAVAEHVAGTEEAFVDLMNQYAQRLGLSGSSFMNSTGLPAEGHYSTARDAAMIARAIIREFPDYYDWYSVKEFSHNDIRQTNRNNLLWRDASVDGLKTGYTRAAGYCLVSSAERDGMRLIAVVMGLPSGKARLDGSQALLNYGFRFFETKKVLSKGQQVSKTRIWKGIADSVALGVTEDVYVTAPRGRADALTHEAELRPQLLAPISLNESVGTISVRYHDQLKTSVPLVALEAVASAGAWTRFVDAVALWFE